MRHRKAKQNERKQCWPPVKPPCSALVWPLSGRAGRWACKGGGGVLWGEQVSGDQEEVGEVSQTWGAQLELLEGWSGRAK